MTHPHLEGLIRKWRDGADFKRENPAGGCSNARADAMECCAQELEAALAALPGGGVDGPEGEDGTWAEGWQERFGWHPIDSIPRDESRVELLSANGKTDAGNWYAFGDYVEPSDDVQDHLNTDNGEGNYTHWRPLSPTPNPHEADRNG